MKAQSRARAAAIEAVIEAALWQSAEHWQTNAQDVSKCSKGSLQNDITIHCHPSAYCNCRHTSLRVTIISKKISSENNARLHQSHGHAPQPHRLVLQRQNKAGHLLNRSLNTHDLQSRSRLRRKP